MLQPGVEPGFLRPQHTVLTTRLLKHLLVLSKPKLWSLCGVFYDVTGQVWASLFFSLDDKEEMEDQVKQWREKMRNQLMLYPRMEKFPVKCRCRKEVFSYERRDQCCDGLQDEIVDGMKYRCETCKK